MGHHLAKVSTSISINLRPLPEEFLLYHGLSEIVDVVAYPRAAPLNLLHLLALLSAFALHRDLDLVGPNYFSIIDQTSNWGLTGTSKAGAGRDG